MRPTTALACLCLAVLALHALPAAAEPPSEASLHELLTTIEAHKLLDGLWTQVDTMMNATL